MLDHVQVIKEKGEAKFAVIPFDDYLYLKELLTNKEKLADYLDYLPMQTVKANTQRRLSLADIKQALTIG